MFKQKHAVVRFYTKSETLAKALYKTDKKWEFCNFDDSYLVCVRRLRYRFKFEKWIIKKMWYILNRFVKD